MTNRTKDIMATLRDSAVPGYLSQNLLNVTAIGTLTNMGNVEAINRMKCQEGILSFHWDSRK